MQPTTFHAASAQAAALPDSLPVGLSSGAHVAVQRLSWLQFETFWQELAALCAVLAQCADLPRRPGAAAHEGNNQSVDFEQAAADRTNENTALAAALAAAPQSVLKLAALSLRQPEAELASWPPGDVMAVAAASLELNFIRPAGVRDFFAAVARIGGG
jgi:hypothetical protein